MRAKEVAMKMAEVALLCARKIVYDNLMAGALPWRSIAPRRRWCANRRRYDLSVLETQLRRDQTEDFPT